jgi:hypothetical protein
MNTPEESLITEDFANGDTSAQDDAATKALKAKFFRLATEEMEFHKKTRGKRFRDAKELEDLQEYIRELHSPDKQ